MTTTSLSEEKTNRPSISLNRVGLFIGDAMLIGLVVLALMPFILMISTSLQDVKVLEFSFDPSSFTIANYQRLFTNYGFGQALITSTIVVVMACIVNAIVSSLAAFAFAKKKFPGSEAIFWSYIATMMVPLQVTLIPLFVMMRNLGLLNTHVSLALPVVNAFGVFLIRQFMNSLPDDIIEAARIDGASDFRLFRSVILPLIRPVLVALTLFTFLSVWNDFLWPLVITSTEDMQTVTLAAARLQGRYTTEYGLLMAGSAVSFFVPFLLYVVLQRQFVQGIAQTGLK